MITYKTKMNMKKNLHPTKLEFKRIEAKRNLLSDYELRYSLKEYEKLHTAKETLINMIREHGKKDWVLIEDYWTRFHRMMGVDFILLTRHACFTFKVTALDGDFSYHEGFTLVDGGVLSGNLVEETWMSRCVIEDILYPADSNLPVFTALILMGETPPTPLGTYIEEVPVVTKELLPNYIQNIIAHEASDTNPLMNIERIIKQLECMEIPKPYLPLSYDQDYLERATKGIHCDKCINYHTEITATHVKCPCGHEETLEAATLRTMNDYKILTYENDKVEPSELLKFFNHQISESYLENNLKSHFPPVN